MYVAICLNLVKYCQIMGRRTVAEDGHGMMGGAFYLLY